MLSYTEHVFVQVQVSRPILFPQCRSVSGVLPVLLYNEQLCAPLLPRTDGPG